MVERKGKHYKKRTKGKKVDGMKKWINMIAIIFALAALAALVYLPAELPLKKGQVETKISELCANFTDASKCVSAAREWEGKVKGSEVYAVIDYQPDGKSTFKEGWIIYMRLSQPLPIPGTIRTTMRIGILADKNSNSSQIYEFVE